MVPKVSILIPAYNAERWLSDTIKSALQQTWPNKEVIVVDDGSRDQTLTVARSFESLGVKVFSQPNQGAAATRNKAFSLSTGKFIQWLDADDLLDKEKIMKQFTRLGGIYDPNVLLSSAWGTFTYRHYKASFVQTALWSDHAPIDWLLLKLGENLSMQTATWLVSREITERVGPWDTTLLGDDDGEYFTRVVLASKEVRFASDAKVFYRRGFSSLSYIGQSTAKMEAQLRSIEANLRYVLAVEDSGRVRSACLRFLQGWVPIFYPEREDLVQRLQDLARSLGGTLPESKLPWKYAWLQTLFGYAFAKRMQIRYNVKKSQLLASVDRIRFDIDRRSQQLQ